MGRWVIYSLLLAAAAALTILSCAAIIHGSKQSVSFQSSPSEASVEVFDAMGMSYGFCETPCKIELKRKNEYKVKITKPGYAPVELVIERKTSGWVWGNILFGGIIGLIVDFTGGSAYRLAPSELHATLAETSGGFLPGTDDGDVLVILDFERLSDTEKARVTGFEKIPLTSSLLPAY